MPKKKVAGGSSESSRLLFIGIDPGKQGAFAMIYPTGAVQTWHVPMVTTITKYPRKKTKSGKPKVSRTQAYDFRAMHLALYSIRKLAATQGYTPVIGLERQNPRNTDAKNVVFQVGRNQGLWEALLGGNNLPFELILPSVWKPRYLATGATKAQSLSLAVKLFPDHDFAARKDGTLLAKEEARAEALLIADYCRRLRLKEKFPRELPSRGRRK